MDPLGAINGPNAESDQERDEERGERRRWRGREGKKGVIGADARSYETGSENNWLKMNKKHARRSFFCMSRATERMAPIELAGEGERTCQMERRRQYFHNLLAKSVRFYAEIDK